MSDPIELEIDLGDGLPPAKAYIGGSAPRRESLGVRVEPAPPPIPITKTPIGLVISVTERVCTSCGSRHREHLGIFVENQFGKLGKTFQRVSMREAGPYLALPKRVDETPREEIPICSDCFVRPGVPEAAAVAHGYVRPPDVIIMDDLEAEDVSPEEAKRRLDAFTAAMSVPTELTVRTCSICGDVHEPGDGAHEYGDLNMERVVNYMILTSAESLPALELRVSLALREGWEPLGAPFASGTGWNQAVVLRSSAGEAA